MKAFRRGQAARMLVWAVIAAFAWMVVGPPAALACEQERGYCPPSDCNCKPPLPPPPSSGPEGGSGAGCCGPTPPNPVQPSTGALSFTGASVGFAAEAGPSFVMWYNNQEADTNNLGPKWRCSYHMKLTFPDSDTVQFQATTGTAGTFTKNVDGSYTPEAGYYDKLVKDGNYYILTSTTLRKVRFDLNGRLDRVIERSDAYDQFIYDGNGRLYQVEVHKANGDATGRKLTFAYDGSNRITSVTDPASRSVQMTYSSGRLYTATDPAGHVTTYGYDGSDRITSVTRNNHTWTYTYDGNNFLASITDPLSHTTSYSYTLWSGNIVHTCTVTDPLNHTTIYEYDSSRRLTKVTDGLSHYRTFTYDNSSNLYTMTNERGKTWTYAYDSYGNRTSVTDPLSHVTEYAYDDAVVDPDDHLVTTITDPLSHVTTFTYSSHPQHNLLTVEDPNGNTTTYTYNTNGTLASVEDARGHTTTYAYASQYSAAYLTSITDPLSNTTTFGYNSVGNRTSVTDARDNTTYYTYDNDGRVTQITNPGSTTRTFTYNCCNVTEVEDENGNTTTYSYDNAERLTSVTDAESDTTDYTYDNANRLTAVTDANDHATSYTYDNANRLTGISYPDSTSEAFTYYNDGALYTRTDGKAVTTTYTRNDVDAVTTIDYPSGTDPTFTYNADGRATRMQDGAADTYYEWNSYGGYTKYDQLIAVRRKYGSMTSYRTTSYQYDENYNRTSMTDAESNTCTYQYDENNRLTQVAKYSVTTTYDYDEVGNRITKTLPTGAYTEYTYNSRNWLTNLENRKDDDTLISSYAYTHDDVGNRLTMTEANGDVTHYDYDDVYRLMSEEKKDDEETRIYRYQYTYDGVGNRLTENNAGTIYYTYDSNNKLTQFVLGDDTTSFGYDDNGNMTNMTLPDETEWEYGYDYENRLTSVTDNDEYTAAYSYAADGMRLRAQESNHQFPDRWFLYDGVRPTAEGTLSGDTFTSRERYVWEGDSYYDPLVYLVWDNARYYPLFDGLGSTRQLTDEDEDVTDTYTHEAFGNLMSSSGSTVNPYRYVGSLGYYQIYPPEGGPALMHLGARYYMPEVGRFLQTDPLGDAHPYAYCEGEPVGWVDANGLGLISAIGDYGWGNYLKDVFQPAGYANYYSCLAACMFLPFTPPDPSSACPIRDALEDAAWWAALRDKRALARATLSAVYSNPAGSGRWGAATFKYSKVMVPKVSLVFYGIDAQRCEGRCAGKANQNQWTGFVGAISSSR